MPALLAWSFPIADWQFWITTALFVIAAAYLLRGLLPVPWLRRRQRQRRQEKRVRLTINRDEP